MVRHGETEWNALGKIQGHQDVGLNEVGRRQAEQLRIRLEGVSIEAAYSSDLSRCADTARTVLLEKGVEPLLTERIREQGFGRWQGLGFREVEERDPELYARMMGRDSDFSPPGGESFREVAERVGGLFDEVRGKNHEGTVLVVGHAGSLRALMAKVLDIPLESSWRFRFDSCGLSMLDVGPDRVRLMVFNDTMHRGIAV